MPPHPDSPSLRPRCSARPGVDLEEVQKPGRLRQRSRQRCRSRSPLRRPHPRVGLPQGKPIEQEDDRGRRGGHR